MLLIERKLLIGIAISETLNSKQFYELFQKLNDDVSFKSSICFRMVNSACPKKLLNG